MSTLFRYVIAYKRANYKMGILKRTVETLSAWERFISSNEKLVLPLEFPITYDWCEAGKPSCLFSN